MISEDHYSIFEKFKSLENMLENGQEKIIDLNFLTKTQQENRVAIMETQVKNQISNFVSEVILNET